MTTRNRARTQNGKRRIGVPDPEYLRVWRIEPPLISFREMRDLTYRARIANKADGTWIDKTPSTTCTHCPDKKPALRVKVDRSTQKIIEAWCKACYTKER